MVFCMLFTMVQPIALAAGEEDPTVELGAVEIAEGDTASTVAVPVSVKNNPGLVGLKIRVTYPEVLTIKDVTFEKKFGTESDNSTDKSNPVTINWGGENEVTGDAKLATINFNLNADAKAGTYDFKVEVVEAFNDDNDWTFATNAGKLTVTSSTTDTVTVTFDGNGGTLATPATVTVKSGEAVAKPTTDPTREGYDFTGWFTDKECKTAYVFTTPVTAPTTLYAGWKVKETTPADVTVTFDGNGGTLATPATVTVKSGEAVAKPATDPTREGYDFTGWFTDKECKTAYVFTTPVTAPFTLYAGWKETSVSVKYGDVDGNGTIDSGDVTALARYLADRKDYMPGGAKAINLANANCDGKGGIDSGDVTSLARHLADRADYAVLPH